MKNVFYIESNQSFLDCLIEGVISRFGEDNLDDMIILLPSKRACRSLKESFIKYFSGKAQILPQIIAIGDFDEEDLALESLIESEMLNMPKPALPPLEQQILLAKLINKHNKLDIVKSLSLAYDLYLLLNELEKEKISPSKLQELEVDDFSIHWQQILDFLIILSEYWPNKINELGKISQISYRSQIITLQNEIWQKKPPHKKIIAAGSCGTISSTASLLKTVSELENGIVILPSLDQDLDEASWSTIDEFHHQYHLKKLLNFIGIERNSIKLWREGHYFCDKSRREFIKEAMRSSSSCEKWSEINSIESKAIKGINYIIADNIGHEATIIALILRSVLEEENKTASLVTNDRDLAKRVISILTRFNINIDDSAGSKLSNTNPVIFIRLVAKMVTTNFSAVDLLGVLKHSFSSISADIVAEIELLILRGVGINQGLASLKQTLKLINRSDLAQILNEYLSEEHEFIQLMQQEFGDFRALLMANLKLAEFLSIKQDDNSLLFDGDLGEELVLFFENLLLHTEELGLINTRDYESILDNFMISGVYRGKNKSTQRISILSPIEARFFHQDIIILSALNEGNFPSDINSGPWINKNMRKKLGLPPLEKQIGQTAHDFYSLACAKELYLTRSSKSGSAATIASRWVQRIETLLVKFNLSINNNYWPKIAKLLNQAENIKPCAPPAPNPDLAYRPKKLSVTEIEKLLRDPYWVYARKILNLKKLDPLSASLSGADFGNFIHQSLDYFTIHFKEKDPKLWYELLIESGKYILQAMIEKPIVQSLWWPRFERIAKWITAREIINLKADQIFSEIRGKMIINQSFELTAKADRLEVDSAGGITIIDYKTGTLPSLNNIRKAIAPQLVLEALIANEKGFTNQDSLASYNTLKLIYIRLTGGEIAGQEMIIENNLEEMIEEARIGISNLISLFFYQKTPFLPAPLPDRILEFNDYEHLSRIKEWS